MQSFTSAESVREINLPDGSTVWLNSNSTLLLPENFSSKHRKLFLKGEAFFEVHKDKDNSFRVFSGNSVTEVLGTSFNINSDTITGKLI
jgi:ferric-dicitrate binding protein FerR (iron transport regulator)